MRTREQLVVALGAARDQLIACLEEHERTAHEGQACLMERIGIVAFIGHSVGLPLDADILGRVLEEMRYYQEHCPAHENCRPAPEREGW